jgi:twitching motility protein PilT
MTKKLNPDPELDGLIRQLNEAARIVEDEEVAENAPVAIPGPAEPAAPMARPEPPSRWALPQAEEDGVQWLHELLSRARESVASDLHLVVGAPPAVRINGRLEPLGARKLTHGEVKLLCAALVPGSRRVQLASRGSVDFSFQQAGLGRFRSNVHRQRDFWSAAVRLFPESSPDLESLNLPPALGRFADLQYGLVLVTGPTGCGKSTTLAALTRLILARRRVHLVTIEDPVEYEHAHEGSLVEHVEIGRDAPSFRDALHSVLRQDPDVLLIGEMRDLDSISIAITAGETGHLVLSTLHTGDAPQTIHRILDSYPPNQIDTVRAQLSVSLAGVVSQQLLPRADGHGRVPAVEILAVTPAVRNLVRRGKIEHIRAQFALERNSGMLDLDDSLTRLVREGLVDREEARSRARVPETFQP